MDADNGRTPAAGGASDGAGPDDRHRVDHTSQVRNVE